MVVRRVREENMAYNESEREFESIEHFKKELVEYIDYYNNRRIKARRKGLPSALHRQQALSAA